MFVIGKNKNKIVKEVNFGNLTARILKTKNEKVFEVEIERDNNVFFRGTFLSIKDSYDRIMNIVFKEKSVEKFARLYQSPPTMENGPSNNPFSQENFPGDAPEGGLLSHYKKIKRRRYPSSSEKDNQYSDLERAKYKYLEQRDSGEDRPGFDHAQSPNDSMDSKHFKPSLPKGEFSLDIVSEDAEKKDRSEEMSPNYVAEYGNVETDQDRRAKYLDDMRKTKVLNQQDDKDKYEISYIDSDGKTKTINNLDFEVALGLQKDPKFMKLKIKKQTMS
jgi:hypothetical protein